MSFTNWKGIENYKQKSQNLKQNLALSIKQTEQIKILLEELGKQSNTILINADKCVKEKNQMILQMELFNTQIKEMQQQNKRSSYKIQKETIKIKEQQNRINFISKFQNKLLQQNQKYLAKRKQLEDKINIEKQLQAELQAEMKFLLNQKDKKNTKQIQKANKDLTQSHLISTSRTNQSLKEDQFNSKTNNLCSFAKLTEILQEVHKLSQVSQLSQSTIKELELTQKKQFQIIDKLQAEKFKYQQIQKKKQLQKQSCQRKKQVLSQKLNKLKHQIFQLQKPIKEEFLDKQNIPSQSNKIPAKKYVSEKQKNIQFYQTQKNNLLSKKHQICQNGKTYVQWMEQMCNKTKFLSQIDQNLLQQKKILDEISKKMLHTRNEVLMIAKYSFQNEQ